MPTKKDQLEDCFDDELPPRSKMRRTSYGVLNPEFDAVPSDEILFHQDGKLYRMANDEDGKSYVCQTR